MIEPNIVVISLKRSKDRTENMQNQVERVGLNNVHFYPAFDGAEIQDTFSLKINIPYGYCYRKGEDLGPRAVACTLSHLGAISLAQSMNWEYVIIFEDDIYLADDFTKRINYLFKILPTDWEHVYLSGVPHHSKELDDNSTLLDFMRVIPSKWTSCSYAYMVKKSTFSKLLKKLATLGSGVDDLINHLIFEDNAIKSYTFFPFPVCANLDIGSESDFGQGKMSDNPSLKYFKNNMT